MEKEFLQVEFNESKKCHWCGNKLQGLLSEFIHCIQCNEKRLGKVCRDFDPCPICNKRSLPN
jgi:hypothetical protein